MKARKIRENFKIYIGNEIVADMHIDASNIVKVHAPAAAEYHLGGAHVFNAVSIADQIKRLGLQGEVVILGTVSSDVFGQHFIMNCADHGINTQNVVRVPESTLLAVVTRGTHNNSFYFPNAESNAMLMTDPDHLPDLPAEEHKILVMQGLCSAMKPSGKHWLRYAREIEDHALIIYDVNARPTLIPDMGMHRKLIDSWAATSGVIKISDADIDAVYSANNSFRAVATRYLDFGTRLVVETRGGKSVRAMSRHGVQEFAIPKLEDVTNTVGAGDNFMAGLTLAFAKARVFSTDQLDKVGKKDVAEFIRSAIAAAQDHLLRQNKQARLAVEPG